MTNGTARAESGVPLSGQTEGDREQNSAGDMHVNSTKIQENSHENSSETEIHGQKEAGASAVGQGEEEDTSAHHTHATTTTHTSTVLNSGSAILCDGNQWENAHVRISDPPTPCQLDTPLV